VALVNDDRATEAARARVASLLDELSRIQLQVVVVGRPDATRQAARDRACDAAITAGRGDLLQEAITTVRDVVLKTFARAGFSGTWAATDMAVSVVRAEDRVAAAAAFEEAAMAAIVEDLVDEDTVDVLRSASAGLRGMAGVPSPGSLSELGTPLAVAVRGPIQVVIVAIGFCVAAAAALAVGSVTGLIVVFGAFALGLGAWRRLRQTPEEGS
jgi:hypothetical protein